MEVEPIDPKDPLQTAAIVALALQAGFQPEDPIDDEMDRMVCAHVCGERKGDPSARRKILRDTRWQFAPGSLRAAAEEAGADTLGKLVAHVNDHVSRMRSVSVAA